MDVLEEGDRVVFLHRVVPGGADRSYGIHVAEIAGVPRALTRRAREILTDLEQRAATEGDKAAGGRWPRPHRTTCVDATHALSLRRARS